MDTNDGYQRSSFANRKEAGKYLALALRSHNTANTLILALPRGGVPVAAEISHVLGLPLEVLAVRKIGVPVFSEVAAGALCENENPHFSENLLLRLGFKPQDLESVVEKEMEELKRQVLLFREGRDLPVLAKKDIILVDDGLATGATMLAAVQFLQKKNVAKITVAVPVASASSIRALQEKVDEILCPIQIEDFNSVSEFYDDFEQTEDQEVLDLLRTHRSKTLVASPFLESLTQNIIPFKKIGDLDILIQSLKDSRIVMLGEATHGTHEYYQLRSTISKKLLDEHGFSFIAVEGDWPDAYRLHRYIQGYGGNSARDVLMQNHRWPTWMWANEEIADLGEWMRGRNKGFFGLDVYSLFESIDEIYIFLKSIDSNLAQDFQRGYSCFDPFERDEFAYARSLLSSPLGCEKQVLDNLKRMLQLNLENNKDELFSAQQNAHIIAQAEKYYREMLKGDAGSWNVRDRHMMETLDRLLDRYGEGAKAIVWAHNTHIGDYRATDMKEEGYINIGGLAREKYGQENVRLVGFGSYQGQVVAGSEWGSPEQVMTLPPAKEKSLEWYCHQIALSYKLQRFHIPLRNLKDDNLKQRILHRAVGVVYDPRLEFRGNYVPTELSKRYDDFIFVDKTHSLRSLHPYAIETGIPETFPFGQ